MKTRYVAGCLALGVVLGVCCSPASAGPGAALSVDGKRLVTVYAEEQVVVWDTATGKIIHELRGHKDKVQSVSISADGKLIATASWDKTVILWDAVTGRKIRTFEGHTGRIFSVSLTADGQFLLTGSEDKTAILWETASGKKRHTFEDAKSWVTAVALSADGKQAAVGSASVSLWDTVSGKKAHTLAGQARGISSVVFSRDGSQVVAGSSFDTRVVLWEAATGKQVRSFEAEGGSVVYSVALSTDRTVLAIGVNQGAIVWNTTTGQKIRSFKTPVPEPITAVDVALTNDKDRLVTSSVTVTVLWDMASGREVHVLKGRLAKNP